MLTLAQQQEGLRALVLGRAVNTEGDAWLAEITASRGLQIMRATIIWWQRFQIEAQCRYTSRLLKRLACFESSVHDCFGESSAPPSIEELGATFLGSLTNHPDRLVRTVALFELTCLTPADEKRDVVVIEWDRNPVDVILALDSGGELPASTDDENFILRVDKEGMKCTRVSRAM